MYSNLQRFSPTLEGGVLDVGCGNKPFAVWLNLERVEHIGIDVYPDPKVDIVVKAGETWSLVSSSFDAIVCTQVLEHVANLQEVLREINRVLKLDGALLVTIPFIYNHHGESDFRRFSIEMNMNLYKPTCLLIRYPFTYLGSLLSVYQYNWLSLRPH